MKMKKITYEELAGEQST